MGGVLAAVFGVYYLGAAVGEVGGRGSGAGFYASTVVGRAGLAAAFGALVAWGAAPRGLLLLAAANAAGAGAMRSPAPGCM